MELVIPGQSSSQSTTYGITANRPRTLASGLDEPVSSVKL